MSDRVFSSEEKAKLTQLINEGITVMQEVEDLQEGLSDTVKAIAEEMQIKPTVLKKAMRTAYKADFDKHSDEYSELENILSTVGKI
jgi:transposase-like protein